MSHTYQTTAKPRGRREDESEKKTPSRTSSQRSSGLSKTSSRTHDDALAPKSVRSVSPTMFWQRNKAADPSRPRTSVLMSPKSTQASMAKAVPDPLSGDKYDASTPMNLVKVLSSKRSAESARASNASIGSNTNKSDPRGATAARERSAASLTISDRPEEEPPTSYLSSKSPTPSQSTAALMQLKVSEPVQEQSSAEDSRPSRIPVQSARTSQPGNRRAHQPPTEVAPQPRVQDYQPPSTTTPVISPPHSPQMMYHDGYSGLQPQYPYYPPPMPPGFYQQPQFFPPTSIPHSPGVPPPGFGNKDENQHVVAKVTSVLPDINRLLEHYQQTQGQASIRDSTAKQRELQHAEEVAHLRLELSTRKEEYEKLIERIAGENHTYKHEIDEQAKRIAELVAGATSASFSQEDITSLKKRTADAIAAAEAALGEKDQLSADKLKLETESERLKCSYAETLQAKDRELHNVANEHNHAVSKMQKEVANLTTRLSQQTNELESSRAVHKSLEQKLELQAKANDAAVAAHKAAVNAKSSGLEDFARQHRQQMESQLASLTSQRLLELQAVRDTHERELRDLRTEHQSKATKMLGEHQTSIQAAQNTHAQALKNIQTEHQSNVAKLSETHHTAIQAIQEELVAKQEAFGKLATEHERLGSRLEQLVGAVTSWKTRHDASEAETTKLKGFLETLGQSERSKSDAT